MVTQNHPFPCPLKCLPQWNSSLPHRNTTHMCYACVSKFCCATTHRNQSDITTIETTSLREMQSAWAGSRKFLSHAPPASRVTLHLERNPPSQFRMLHHCRQTPWRLGWPVQSPSGPSRIPTYLQLNPCLQRAHWPEMFSRTLEGQICSQQADFLYKSQFGVIKLKNNQEAMNQDMGKKKT